MPLRVVTSSFLAARSTVKPPTAPAVADRIDFRNRPKAIGVQGKNTALSSPSRSPPQDIQKGGRSLDSSCFHEAHESAPRHWAGTPRAYVTASRGFAKGNQRNFRNCA